MRSCFRRAHAEGSGGYSDATAPQRYGAAPRARSSNLADPPHFVRPAICASIGPAGIGLSMISIRSFATAAL